MDLLVKIVRENYAFSGNIRIDGYIGGGNYLKKKSIA